MCQKGDSKFQDIYDMFSMDKPTCFDVTFGGGVILNADFNIGWCMGEGTKINRIFASSSFKNEKLCHEWAAKAERANTNPCTLAHFSGSS